MRHPAKGRALQGLLSPPHDTVTLPQTDGDQTVFRICSDVRVGISHVATLLEQHGCDLVSFGRRRDWGECDHDDACAEQCCLDFVVVGPDGHALDDGAAHRLLRVLELHMHMPCDAGTHGALDDGGSTARMSTGNECSSSSDSPSPTGAAGINVGLEPASPVRAGGSGGGGSSSAPQLQPPSVPSPPTPCTTRQRSCSVPSTRESLSGKVDMLQRSSSSGNLASKEAEDEAPWWGAFRPHDCVHDIMSSPLRWVSADADLGTAKQLMTLYGISALMVDTGTPEPGFLTKRGFLHASFNKNLKHTKVFEVMTQPVVHVDVCTTIDECLKLMHARSVRRVPVRHPARFDPDTRDSWLSCWLGMVSETDIFSCVGQPHTPVAAERDAHQFDAPASVMHGWSPPSSSTASSVVSCLSLAHRSSRSVCSGAVSSVGAVSTARASRAMAGPAAHGFGGDRYRTAASLWELDYDELEIIRRIGEGSFGEVLLANFRGTKVAAKRLRAFDTVYEDAPLAGNVEDDGLQPVLLQFFEREIDILASIRHPNIVCFIGACHTPPNLALVTEFCARGSLDLLLHKSGLTLDLPKRIEFAVDIARGMSCLHAQKPAIIHRDLKPANLLVSARFEVKVADFGLSRIKDHAHLVNSRAGMEGTVEYAAPEVLRGDPFTEKCDVWSFGVILWELFNRQRPYADADVPIYLLMMSLANGNLTLPPLHPDTASAGLAQLVERCLSWEAADRPSFREVLHSLEAEYKIVRGKAAAVRRCDSARMLTDGQQPMPPIKAAALGSSVDMSGLVTAPASVPLAPPPLRSGPTACAQPARSPRPPVHPTPLAQSRLRIATGDVARVAASHAAAGASCSAAGAPHDTAGSELPGSAAGSAPGDRAGRVLPPATPSGVPITCDCVVGTPCQLVCVPLAVGADAGAVPVGTAEQPQTCAGQDVPVQCDAVQPAAPSGPLVSPFDTVALAPFDGSNMPPAVPPAQEHEQGVDQEPDKQAQAHVSAPLQERTGLRQLPSGERRQASWMII